LKGSGKAAAYICTPEANLGHPPREASLIQLREARAESRRRKSVTRLAIEGNGRATFKRRPCNWLPLVAKAGIRFGSTNRATAANPVKLNGASNASEAYESFVIVGEVTLLAILLLVGNGRLAQPERELPEVRQRNMDRLLRFKAGGRNRRYTSRPYLRVLGCKIDISRRSAPRERIARTVWRRSQSRANYSPAHNREKYRESYARCGPHLIKKA
jgi:hypothetical protein